MKKLFLATSILGFGLSGAAFASSKSDVLTNYANIAQAKYEDSLTTAKTLQAAVEKLIAEPTEENLEAAKSAWARGARTLSTDRSVSLRQCDC